MQLVMVDVLLVEDHSLLGLGLQAQLRERGVKAGIASLGSVGELLDQVVAARPALVVLDLGLPLVGGGAALVGPIVGLGAPVLVLTGETDVELIARCFESGALGVVNKDQELSVILASIDRARRGEIVNPHQRGTVLKAARDHRRDVRDRLAQFDSLSPREQTVLSGIIEGLSATQIATRDFVSIGTVRTQIKAVLRKLDVSSQLEAVAAARRAGWIAAEVSPTPEG